MAAVHAQLAGLESTIAEKTEEVEALQGALAEAKTTALSAVASERQHTDDLIQREEKLLGTLVHQLSQSQTDELVSAMQVPCVQASKRAIHPCTHPWMHARTHRSIHSSTKPISFMVRPPFPRAACLREKY